MLSIRTRFSLSVLAEEFIARITFDCIIHRTGDIAMLQVEAVVNPTNENLTDKNPISLRLYEVAGPELREECKSQVGSE